MIGTEEVLEPDIPSLLNLETPDIMDLFCHPCIQIQFHTFQSQPFGHGIEVLRPQFFTSVVSHLCHYIIQLNFTIQLTVEETIRACTVQCSLSFFVHKVHEGQQRCTGAGAPLSSSTSMLHSTLAPWSIFNLYVSSNNLTQARLQVPSFLQPPLH